MSEIEGTCGDQNRQDDLFQSIFTFFHFFFQFLIAFPFLEKFTFSSKKSEKLVKMSEI